MKAIQNGVLTFNELTPYTCPECHGVLSRLQEGNIIRYRCHTGHAYSVDTLMQAMNEKIEASLYSAIRGMDESTFLLNHLGDHYAECNEPQLAALYFKKAKEIEERSKPIRKAAKMNEDLTRELFAREIQNENVDE